MSTSLRRRHILQTPINVSKEENLSVRLITVLVWNFISSELGSITQKFKTVTVILGKALIMEVLCVISEMLLRLTQCESQCTVISLNLDLR